MKLLYVSHAITSPTPTLLAANLEAAGIWGDRFFRQDFICYGPWNVREAPPYATPEEAWDHAMAQCLPLVGLCDAVFMCPGWETSRGCKAEMDAALAAGKKVFFSVDDLLRCREAVLQWEARAPRFCAGMDEREAAS